MDKDTILLVLTGGTICSFSDEKGEKSTDIEKAKSLIVEKFRKTDSKYRGVEFENRMPIDTLSENMTLDKWNTLISALKGYDLSEYKGVIILHGTDTLAYTSSLLSLLLAGIKVPVFLVSSQESLESDTANGNENFRVAVEFIMNGIVPNVYVPYKNSDGKMYLHLGAHLTQCAPLSNDFYSLDAKVLETDGSDGVLGVKFETNSNLLEKIGELFPCVLKITPYVALDYSVFNMDKIKAVVHGTYHSQTLCAEEESSKFSVFALSKCFRDEKTGKAPEIPLFIEPCNYKENENKSCYETTALAVKKGAISVWGMTSEMVYVKALVGTALGKERETLVDFMLNQNINHEKHY